MGVKKNLKESEPFDELYTPLYAIIPIIKYLKHKKFKTVWCPFDTEKSQYYKVLTQYNFNVLPTHINNKKDFLNYEPKKDYDVILSNPPFSIKDSVLKRAYELKKPFAFLLPITTLEGIARGKLFRKFGIQVLVFDKRVNFMKESGKKACWFNTSYFCYNVLDKDLIFEKLNKGDI